MAGMDENSYKARQSIGSHASRLSRIREAIRKAAVYFVAAFFAIIAAPLQILMFLSDPDPTGNADPVVPGSFRHLVLAAFSVAIAAVVVYAMRTNAKTPRTENWPATHE